MLSFLKSLFVSDKFSDTVLDLVRDVTGLNDLNDAERARLHNENIALLTQYQQATKHQSKTRRFIAVSVTCVMLLFVLTWIVSQGFGTLMDWQPGVYFAARVKVFYEEVLVMPTSLVLGFYFGVQALNSLQSKQTTGK